MIRGMRRVLLASTTAPVHVSPVIPHGLLAELGWLLGLTPVVTLRSGAG